MSKTFLVAQREYLENVRTKTFWIGIVSFPLLFALFIVGGRILAKSKDVRSYTVIDRSAGQWLSQAIEERGATGDLERIQTRLRDRLAELEGSSPAELARELERIPADIAQNPVQQEFFERLLAALRPELEKPAAERAQDPAVLMKRVVPTLVPWFTSLDRARLTQLGSDLDRSRYRRVPLPEAGSPSGSDDGIDDLRKRLNQRVQSGELFAYFVIGPDPVASEQGSEYVSNNLTDQDLRNWYERHATELIRERRITALNLTKQQAQSLLDPFDFVEQKVSASGESETVEKADKASKFAPVGFVYLLWIAVFTAAQMLLTNTVEEKSNRLIEVLLSSVSPMQLMAGKVIGIAATGLTIVLSWVVSAMVGVQFMSSGALGGIDLVAIIGDPLYLSSFVAYFLAGYLLYAAVLVAIGSVCNSLKEAQNLMQPVFIVLIVPLVAMMFVVQDPNGTVARILTYIPLFTPFLMMNRAGGPPPAIEYVISTVVILVSLYLAFLGAAKIFRVGILMTGKPPRFREILRWLRAPVGAVAIQTRPGEASP